METKSGIAALFVLLLVAVTFSYLTGPTSRSVKFTYGSIIREGRVVTDALEKYRNDHGVYPDYLYRLAPRYLAKISMPQVKERRRWPRKRWLAKWVYQPSAQENSFKLKPEDVRFGYESQTGEWTFLGGGPSTQIESRGE